MKDEEWKVLDRKALGTIQLCMASSVAFNILKENTTKGVTSTFINLYEKPSAYVEAWKFAGNNRKGFSPVNVPN